MKLELQLSRRRLVVDGRVLAAPRSLWALPVLDCQLRSGGSPLTREALMQALQPMGLRGQLSARQMVRVWKALEALFTAADQPEALRERLHHLPRALSVGPWQWRLAPDDDIQLESQPSAPLVRPGETAGPGFAASGDCSSALALFVSLQEAMAMTWKGLPEEALALLDETARWQDASPALAALLALRRGELLGRLRRFAPARRALAASRHRLALASPAAGYLLAHVDIAQARLSYGEDPQGCYATLLRQMPARQALASASGDAVAMAEMHNLQGLCLRRQLEASVNETPALRRALFARMLDSFQASLFHLIAAQLFERAQNVCANLAYAYQRAASLIGPDQRQLALQWYAVSARMSVNFDLAYNSAWDFIFIGELWLETHAHSPVALPADVHWQGERPDELSFYLTGVREADRTADPRQQAIALLNLHRFAVLKHLTAQAGEAFSLLAQLLRAQPQLGAVLLAEGYQLPRMPALAVVG